MSAAQTWHSRYAAATAPITRREPTPAQKQALLQNRLRAQAENWPASRFANAYRAIMGLEPWDAEFCKELDEADSRAALHRAACQQLGRAA